MDKVLLSKGLKEKEGDQEMMIIIYSREQGTLIEGTALPAAEVTTWQ